ncbi:MAG: MarR family winged helix-turn-helix transcriptional regulator [Candidatus Dormibacteria bacterium]
MFTSVNSTDPEEIAAGAGRGRLIKRFASLQWQLGQAIRTHVNASLGSTGGPVSAAIKATTPHQRWALMALAQEGPLPMGELARRLGITASSATEVMDRLVEHGWVERLPAATDRRAVVVRLTRPAQEMAEQVRDALTSGTQALLAGLDDRELATLVALQERVVAAGRVTADPIPDSTARRRTTADGLE